MASTPHHPTAVITHQHFHIFILFAYCQSCLHSIAKSREKIASTGTKYRIKEGKRQGVVSVHDIHRCSRRTGKEKNFMVTHIRSSCWHVGPPHEWPQKLTRINMRTTLQEQQSLLHPSVALCYSHGFLFTSIYFLVGKPSQTFQKKPTPTHKQMHLHTFS